MTYWTGYIFTLTWILQVKIGSKKNIDQHRCIVFNTLIFFTSLNWTDWRLGRGVNMGRFRSKCMTECLDSCPPPATPPPAVLWIRVIASYFRRRCRCTKREAKPTAVADATAATTGIGFLYGLYGM